MEWITPWTSALDQYHALPLGWWLWPSHGAQEHLAPFLLSWTPENGVKQTSSCREIHMGFGKMCHSDDGGFSVPTRLKIYCWWSTGFWLVNSCHKFLHFRINAPFVRYFKQFTRSTSHFKKEKNKQKCKKTKTGVKGVNWYIHDWLMIFEDFWISIFVNLKNLITIHHL